MPFSNGAHLGKYRYFIDPNDPSTAILQEFAEPHPIGYRTISIMRFRAEKVKSVMFDRNVTITTTTEGVYMGVISDDAQKLYDRVKRIYQNRVIMVSGCHLIISQSDKDFFDKDVVFYYDKTCKVCVKKVVNGADKCWQIVSKWPDLLINTEIVDGTLITEV
jgi:hypothetical protein